MALQSRHPRQLRKVRPLLCKNGSKCRIKFCSQKSSLACSVIKTFANFLRMECGVCCGCSDPWHGVQGIAGAFPSKRSCCGEKKRCLAKRFRPACIPAFAKSYRWLKLVYFNHVPLFQPACFWWLLAMWLPCPSCGKTHLATCCAC